VTDVNYLSPETGMRCLGVYTERERSTTTLPVGATADTGLRTVAVLSVGQRGADTPGALLPGDLLKIYGRVRFTNDIGPISYTVGISAWFDGYDIDDGVASADKVWVSSWLPDSDFGARSGMNVDRNIVHHLLMSLPGDWYQIPDTFPAGHRLAVAWRGAAASTAYAKNGGGDVITIDNYVSIAAEHWRL
jgi:hypothetical protein